MKKTKNDRSSIRNPGKRRKKSTGLMTPGSASKTETLIFSRRDHNNSIACSIMSLHRENGRINILWMDGDFLPTNNRSIQGEIVGVSIDELWGVEVVNQVKPFFEQTFSGKHSCFAMQVQDDLLYIVLIPQIRNQPSDSLICVSVDTIDRSSLQEKLLQSEIRLLRFSETMLDVITETDGNAMISYVSPSVTRLFGFQEKDIIGSSYFDWIHPDDKKNVMLQARSDYELAKQGGSRISRQEFRAKRADGNHMWVEAAVHNLFDENNHFISAVSVLRDVTERRQAQEAMKEEQRFVEALRDTTAALASTLNSDEILDRILVNVSRVVPHDTATIMLLEENGDISIVRHRGYVEMGLENTINSFKLPLKELASLRKMVEKGQPYFVPDLSKDSSWVQFPGLEWQKSYLGAPIRLKGKLLGFINLESRETEFFNQTHADHLLALADQAAIAIQNSRLFSELTERGTRLEMINQISLAISSGLEMREVLNAIYEQCQRIATMDFFYVATYDPLTRLLDCPFFVDKGIISRKPPRLIDEQPGYTGYIVKTRRTLFIHDINDPHHQPSVEIVAWNEGASGSFIGIPLIFRDDVVGVIAMQSLMPNVYQSIQVSMLELVGRQAAVALNNARLFAQSQRNADQMATLFRIGMTVTSGLDMDHVLKTLYDECVKVAPIDAFYLALFDEETEMIHFPLFRDQDEFIEVPPRPTNKSGGLTEYVLKTRRTLYIPNLMDPKYEIPGFDAIKAGKELTRSYIGVPLLLRDKSLGVLSMQSYQPNIYSQDQIQLLETIATQATIAIENARLYSEIQHLAIVDELTSLYNYRALIELGNREVERARRFARPLSALFCDIDHFREFNNQYSHLVGNQVLRIVSKTCRETVRIVDIVARFGGEEFVILLPETDLKAALPIAERLRLDIEKSRISTARGELGVTVSIGVAQLSADMPDLTSLIDKANLGEHIAKHRGRNRVESYEG